MAKCNECKHYWGDGCQAGEIPLRVYEPNKETTCKRFHARMSKDNRGGAGPGAGRKAYDPEQKRIQITISVHRDTRDKLNAISRARGISPGRVVDEMVKDEW